MHNQNRRSSLYSKSRKPKSSSPLALGLISISFKNNIFVLIIYFIIKQNTILLKINILLYFYNELERKNIFLY